MPNCLCLPELNSPPAFCGQSTAPDLYTSLCAVLAGSPIHCPVTLFQSAHASPSGGTSVARPKQCRRTVDRTTSQYNTKQSVESRGSAVATEGRQSGRQAGDHKLSSGRHEQSGMSMSGPKQCRRTVNQTASQHSIKRSVEIRGSALGHRGQMEWHAGRQELSSGRHEQLGMRG